MQLIHVPGFINRVVYNGCKAYADQLKAGETYTKLTDVVAISICDFEMWPNAQQDGQGLPRIPMLSRWYMTESLSSNGMLPEQATNRLLQVQYALLELAKLPTSKPTTGAAQWAWLFVHAPELTSIPAALPPGPHREALELANQGMFTPIDLDAYRRVMDEIQQTREYGAFQRAEGKTEAKAEWKAEAILAVLAARRIAVHEATRARILGCSDAAKLDEWLVLGVSVSSAKDVINLS